MATLSEAMKGNQNARKNKEPGAPRKLPTHKGMKYYNVEVAQGGDKYKMTQTRGLTKDGSKSLGVSVDRADSMMTRPTGYAGRGLVNPKSEPPTKAEKALAKAQNDARDAVLKATKKGK